jgi:hypothetical protein
LIFHFSCPQLLLQARDAAEAAERDAKGRAAQLQREADALAAQLANQKGEYAYAARDMVAEEGGRLLAELELAQREAATLQATVLDMRAQVGWGWEVLLGFFPAFKGGVACDW